MTEAFEIPQLRTPEGHILVDRLLEAAVDAALLDGSGPEYSLSHPRGFRP